MKFEHITKEVQAKVVADILAEIVMQNTRFCPYFNPGRFGIPCEGDNNPCAGKGTCRKCIARWATEKAAMTLNGVETFLQDENGELV